jgi:8-oxo-dGTP pyrophosphatase MutT (NUDIX family)
LRETWEEVGVLVGRRGPPPGSLAPLAPLAPPRATAVHGLPPAAAAYAEHGIAAALDVLTYVGRAITPTPVFRRFNTRFFLADGAAVFGEPVSTDELEDVGWHPIGRRSLTPFRDVTQFMLARAMALRDRTASPDAPLLCTVRNRRRVLVCREAALDL